MDRSGSNAPFRALLALVALLLALGCGGYRIAIEPVDAPAPTAVEPAPVAAPATTEPAAAATPGPAAPRPSTGARPTPAPAPAPVSGGGWGQVQVTTGAAVQAMVDGAPMPFTAEQGFVSDVPEGAHEVEIYNLVGKLTATASVDVPAGQRVRFSYKSGAKALTQTSTVAASAVPVPEPVVVPVPEPALPGSVEITGLASYGDAVFVDGYAARYDARATSYIRSGLAEGSHDLRVEIDRRVVYTGPVDVLAGQNHRCVASWSGVEWLLDCHWTRPAL